MAKQVRTETGIGKNPVSVAYAAVSMASRIFDDFSRANALLIGAGETIELVARHLHEAGVRQLTVANRTRERAEQVSSSLGGTAITLPEIPDALEHADIVISSTASPLPIFGQRDGRTGAEEASPSPRVYGRYRRTPGYRARSG